MVDMSLKDNFVIDSECLIVIIIVGCDYVFFLIIKVMKEIVKCYGGL